MGRSRRPGRRHVRPGLALGQRRFPTPRQVTEHATVGRSWGGEGSGTDPSPVAPLSPYPMKVPGPQLPPQLPLVSLLCVCFLLPLHFASRGGRRPPTRPSDQPPNPRQDPPLAAAQSSSPGPAAAPERGQPESLPGSRRPDGSVRRCGARAPQGTPRPSTAAHSPASSSWRLWLKVCSCRSLVSPLVRRNLEMKDTAAAISPIMVAARV